jgi:hypothetical protein
MDRASQVLAQGVPPGVPIKEQLRRRTELKTDLFQARFFLIRGRL